MGKQSDVPWQENMETNHGTKLASSRVCAKLYPSYKGFAPTSKTPKTSRKIQKTLRKRPKNQKMAVNNGVQWRHATFGDLTSGPPDFRWRHLRSTSLPVTSLPVHVTVTSRIHCIHPRNATWTICERCPYTTRAELSPYTTSYLHTQILNSDCSY